MRKILMLEHVSLDGYAAGPRGEMGWIHVDEEIFDYTGPLIDGADTAIYGRVTYGMMEAYWPTAGDRPGASRHDVSHSRWANNATKVVVSSTLETATWAGSSDKVVLIKSGVVDAVRQLKEQPGRDIALIGSISVAHILISHRLVDELWINVNPVILGGGKPMFPEMDKQVDLEVIETRAFGSGVVGVHYALR